MSVGERLVYQMDQVGVDKMCIMTSDHRRVYPGDGGPYTPNDYLLEVRKAAPDRFSLTCSVDPFRGIKEGVKEIERCIKGEGFSAFKLYPSYDHFDPGDEQLDPIYKKLVELDTTMQVHMGWTPCKNAPMKFQQPYLLDAVAARFPDLKIVVAHVGWPWVDECLALVAKWENIHVDFAYWGWFGAETTFQAVKRLGEFCGYDRLLFGSENSHTHMAVDMFKSFGDVAKKLGAKPISSEDMEKIMWKNTARLWKIAV
jgi:predicted TIM-barrel fold metal-dependent hydrolase